MGERDSSNYAQLWTGLKHATTHLMGSGMEERVVGLFDLSHVQAQLSLNRAITAEQCARLMLAIHLLRGYAVLYHQGGAHFAADDFEQANQLMSRRRIPHEVAFLQPLGMLGFGWATLVAYSKTGSNHPNPERTAALEQAYAVLGNGALIGAASLQRDKLPLFYVMRAMIGRMLDTTEENTHDLDIARELFRSGGLRDEKLETAAVVLGEGRLPQIDWHTYAYPIITTIGSVLSILQRHD